MSSPERRKQRSLIYMNSEFHKKALARAAPPVKEYQREKTEMYAQLASPTKNEKGERGGKQPGPICWNGNGPMPIPNFNAYPKGEKPCYTGTVRNETWCCDTRGKFDLDHSTFDQWSKLKSICL